MEDSKRPNGGKQLWPVMLTPFTEDGAVDYAALERLIEWYQENGAHGLFSLCQSSEMFFLTLEERIKMASFIMERASIPVIASGHVSERLKDQVEELNRIAETGVSAVILLTNRIAGEGADTKAWLNNMECLMGQLDESVPLGFYECPYPFRRLFSDEELSVCASTGRFHFLKDTCCDLETIRRRLRILDGSKMAVYNANTATLLDSLRAGAAGFSGVMLNFHPDLYAWLIEHWDSDPEKARTVQELLTLCSLCEAYGYPVNAKYHLRRIGLPFTLQTRSRDPEILTPGLKTVTDQMDHFLATVRSQLFV